MHISVLRTKTVQLSISFHKPFNCQLQQLSTAFSSACDFKSDFCKQCGPRSDCFSRSSLIRVHTVCLYAKIGLCFSVLLILRLHRSGKRELILVLFVRLFGLCLFRFVGFLFLLGSWKVCGL